MALSWLQICHSLYQVSIKYKMEQVETQCDSSDDQVAIAGRPLVSIQGRRVSEYPYNCIGILYMFTPLHEKPFTGTAFFISEDEIVTVAHNLLVVLKKEHKRYLFLVGELSFYVYDEEGQPEEYQIVDYRLHARYQQKFNYSDAAIYDFALLKVSRKAKRGRFLQLGFDFDVREGQTLAGVNQKSMSVYGYQTPHVFSKFRLNMEGCENKDAIRSINKQLMIYLLSTKGGHSGSPVFYEGKVIGLHKGGKDPNSKQLQQQENEEILEIKEESFNYARLITSRHKEYDGDMVHHLYRWSLEMDRENSKEIFARIYPFGVEDIRKETFWEVDRKYIDKNAVQEPIVVEGLTIKDKVVSKNQGSVGWSQLISRNKMKRYGSIYIKDIKIQKSAALCLGFISEDNKLKFRGCPFDGCQANSIGVMLTKSKKGNNLVYSLRINNVEVTKGVLPDGSDLIIKFWQANPNPTSKKSSKSQKYEEKVFALETGRKQSGKMLKGDNIIREQLMNQVYGFDFGVDYFFYANMMGPNTSAYIEL